jgi:uncharacterized protein with beta-barrel porin domain
VIEGDPTDVNQIVADEDPVTLSSSLEGNKAALLTVFGSSILTLNNNGSFIITSGSSTGGISAGGEIHLSGTGTLYCNGNSANEDILWKVGPNSRLRGTGRISSLTLDGILQPGNSIGTMSVLGAAAFNSGSNVKIELNKAQDQISKVAASGAVTINNGSTLTLLLEEGTSGAGYYIHDAYDPFVTGSTLTGEFTTIVSDIVRFNIADAIGYGETHTTLDLGSALIASAAGDPALTAYYTSLVAIENPTEAEQALINTILTTPLALGGEQYGSLINASRLMKARVVNSIYQPLRPYLRDPCKMRGGSKEAFLDAAGHGGSYNDAYSSGGISVAAGAFATRDQFLFGTSLFYDYDSLSFSKSQGNLESNSVLGSLFALYRPARYYLFTTVAGGYSFNDMEREASNSRYHAQPNSASFLAYGEAGYDLFYKKALIQPFAALLYGYGNWASFTESGASPLSASSYNNNDLIGRIGAHTYFSYKSHDFGLDAAYEYRFTPAYNYRTLTLSSITQAVYGFLPSKSTAFIDLHYNRVLSTKWRFFADASCRVQDRFVEASLLGGAAYAF